MQTRIKPEVRTSVLGGLAALDADLEVVSRTLVGRQPFGIRQAWRPFPVPLARGGEHGVEGDGVGGRYHRPDRGAAVRHRTAPVPTIKVVEALRFFLREGVQWREL